jgi:hypothetical protein
MGKSVTQTGNARVPEVKSDQFSLKSLEGSEIWDPATFRPRDSLFQTSVLAKRIVVSGFVAHRLAANAPIEVFPPPLQSSSRKTFYSVMCEGRGKRHSSDMSNSISNRDTRSRRFPRRPWLSEICSRTNCDWPLPNRGWSLPWCHHHRVGIVCRLHKNHFSPYRPLAG